MLRQRAIRAPRTAIAVADNPRADQSMRVFECLVATAAIIAAVALAFVR